MSLIFFDGFDGYDSTADIVSFGGWSQGPGAGTIETGRFGAPGKAMFINLSNFAIYTLPSDQISNTLFIGFALNMATGLGASAPIIKMDNNVSVTQCYLGINTVSGVSYKLAAYRGATQIAVGTTTLSVDTWYNVQIKVKVDDASGIFDCLLEGASEFTFAGDTKDTGSATLPAIIVFAGDNITIDDFYICNQVGTLNNTYLGDVRAVQLPLTGDSTVAMTRNTGASNYLAVDELLGAPDDDTTYVYSATPTTRDEYTLTDTTAAGVISGVKVNIRARKDAANPRSLKYGTKTGADEQLTTRILGTSYSNSHSISETYNGTDQWTVAKLDAALAVLEVA